MGRMVLFVIGLLVWLVFTWPYNHGDLVIGLLVAGFVAYLTGDMFAENPQIYTKPRKYLWMLYFIFIFVVEYIKASLQMIVRLSRPGIKVKPGIVKVKTDLKSETGMAFLANSITLGRGTLAVDIEGKEGYIYMHCMDVDARPASEATIRKFEDILKRVFE